MLNSPQSIINILELYDFIKPHLHNNEIRFGISAGHNSKSIRIKLKDNDNLLVKDFARGITRDLISYIMHIRKVEFKQVLNLVKSELNITDFYEFNSRKSVFGGFYDNIKNRDSILKAQTYEAVKYIQ